MCTDYEGPKPAQKAEIERKLSQEITGFVPRSVLNLRQNRLGLLAFNAGNPQRIAVTLPPHPFTVSPPRTNGGFSDVILRFSW